MDQPDFEQTRVLLQKVAGGDDRALNEIFRRYQARVLSVVRKRSGPKVRAECDSIDVAQSAMLDAIKGIDRFEMRDEESFMRWLATVVENKIRAKVQRAGRIKRDPGALERIDAESSRAPGVDPVAGGASPSTHAAADEERELIARAIKRLPDEWRQVVELREVRELDWDEIVRQTGLTKKAAQAKWGRGKARLAIILHQLGFR